MLRNTLTFGLSAAALVVSVAAFSEPVRAADVKPAKAKEIQALLKKMYGDLKPFEGEDAAETNKILSEIQKLIDSNKDAKANPLKFPSVWVDGISEARFGGKAGRKAASTKTNLKLEAPARGTDGKDVKIPYAAYAGAKVAAKVASPLILAILPKGADPAAHIEAWKTIEEVKTGDWIVAAVAESDVVDFQKQPIYAAQLYFDLREKLNFDPNQVYMEGVGTACNAAQYLSDQYFADRLAGLVLRNPQEAKVGANQCMFPMAIVYGPEGNEKAKAVHEAYKTAFADRAAAIQTETVDQVTGGSPTTFAWLGAGRAVGRRLPESYQWQTTMTDQVGAPLTGNFWIERPVTRGQPTKLKVSFTKATNVVNIEAENLDEFRVLMNDDQLDLDKPVSIFVNGNQVVSKQFERRLKDGLEWGVNVGEFGRFFPAYYQGLAPKVVPAAAEKKPDEKAPEAPKPEEKK